MEAGQSTSINFEHSNQGVQTGANYGSINIHHAQASNTESPPAPFRSIPYPRNRNFVSRGDLIDRVLQQCDQPGGRFALVGMGGVGKTQLAVEAAHRIADARPDAWVFWVHCSTRERIEADFRNIVDILKIPGRDDASADIPDLLWKWLLNERNPRWTIVLDNADQGEFLLEKGKRAQCLASYLPFSRHGSVIVTSRYSAVARPLVESGELVKIEPMSQTEAQILLETRLTPLGPLSEDAKKAGVELVDELDCVPLAVSQAAAYILAMSPQMSIDSYLTKFRENEASRDWLLEQGEDQLQLDEKSRAALTTWHISFEHIREKQSSAADLLSLMSFFDRQAIPEWVLKKHHTTLKVPARKRDMLRNMFKPFKGSRADSGSRDRATSRSSDSGIHRDAIGKAAPHFETDIKMLLDFSLVSAGAEGNNFEMHRLVQRSMKKWLRSNHEFDKLVRQFIQVMETSFPDEPEVNSETCRELIPHAQLAIEHRPERGDDLKGWADLMGYVGNYKRFQGNYAIAEEMFRQVACSREQRLGENHRETLGAKFMTVRMVYNQSHLQEAEKLCSPLVQISETMFGSKDLLTLRFQALLANISMDQGRLDEAEKIQCSVLAASKELMGDNHPDTLTLMNNLATIYYDQGRFEEAGKLHVTVLTARQNLLGKKHPHTINSMNNLATIYYDQGRFEEAGKLHVTVLTARQNLLGKDHLHTLNSMHDLARTLHDLGRVDEAHVMMQDCLSKREKIHGPDHPHTKYSQEWLEYWQNQERRWVLWRDPAVENATGNPGKAASEDGDEPKTSRS